SATGCDRNEPTYIRPQRVAGVKLCARQVTGPSLTQRVVKDALSRRAACDGCDGGPERSEDPARIEPKHYTGTDSIAPQGIYRHAFQGWNHSASTFAGRMRRRHRPDGPGRRAL